MERLSCRPPFQKALWLDEFIEMQAQALVAAASSLGRRTSRVWGYTHRFR